MIKRTNPFCSLTPHVQELQGLLRRIVIDDKINPAEMHYLDAWLHHAGSLKNTWPCCDLYSFAHFINGKQKITTRDHVGLLLFCKAVLQNEVLKATSHDVANLLTAGNYYEVDALEFYSAAKQKGENNKRADIVVCEASRSLWLVTCYALASSSTTHIRTNGTPFVLTHHHE